MAKQEFYQPPKRRRDLEQDRSADFNEPLVTGAAARERAHKTSAGAQNTLDNIDDVLGAEKSGATPDHASASDGGLAQGFDDNDTSDNGAANGKGRIRKTFWSSRRRKQASIGGTLITMVLGGGIWGAVITSGPLELIHAGELLRHPFSKLESDSSDRSSHLLRYARALKKGDYRYTKLSGIGSKVMLKTLTELDDAGFSITGENALGKPTEISLDRSKLETVFPETSEMSAPEFRTFMAEKLGVSADNIALPDKTGKYKLDMKYFKFNQITAVLKNGQIGLLGDGKIVAGLKTRVIGKFFGLGSLFHPFSKALSQKLSDKVTAYQEKKKTAKEAEDDFNAEQDAANTTKVTAEGDATAKGVKDEVDKQNRLTKGIALAGLVIAGACIVHGAAEEIPKFDYLRVVAPSEIQATSVLAKASQTKDGTGGISSNQVGAVVQGFYNNAGQSVFQGAGMEALAKGSAATDSKGNYVNDLPAEDRQAYEQHSTARTLNDVALNVLDGLSGPFAFLKLVGVKHPGKAFCTTPVQIGLVVLSTVAQGVADFFSGGGAQVAIGAAEAGESAVLQQYVIGSAIQWIEKWFVNSKTAGRLAVDAFKGPVGGDLLSFGARAAAGVAAIGSGGVSLPDDHGQSSTSTYVSAADRADQLNFEHQSMFAKIFDAQDYRSLTGRLADDVNPGRLTNFSSIFGSLLNVGGSIFGVFGNLMPHASALSNNSWSGSFNWGFPQYGLPQDMLNDPNLQNPYTNANNVGQMLSSSCQDASGNIGPDKGDCSGDQGYTSRIRGCFANNLTYDGTSWDVTPIPNTEVNPNDSPYADDHCGDTSNTTWRQIVMYAFDTNTMKDIACYTGDDDQSCTDEGISTGDSSSGSSSTGTTSSGSGNVEEGSDAQLAKKLLDYKKTGQYNCDNPGDCTDLQKMVNGTSLSGSDGCQADKLDPRVLQLLLYLIENGKFKIGTYALCGDHSFDSAKGHSGGFAVDISSINGVSVVTDSTAAKTNTLTVDKFLNNSLPSALQLNQQISYGYGNHYDADLAATQQYNGQLCNGSCVSIYTPTVEAEHENHIHAGY